MYRQNTRVVNVGDVPVGGGNLISIQSMTNTDTRDIAATVNQIKKLEEAGCEIVRVAVLDMEAARAIKQIKSSIKIPLVADIHFDYRLALESIENGIDKLRINPGNIGSIERIKQVVNKAAERNIPIRIGVNSGSLEKDILEKHKTVNASGLVESALRHTKILEDLNFDKIIISIKASSVNMTIEAYELISKQVNYPLHVGITESGTIYSGSIKSSVGVGAILSRGIGDTIRISLTSDPVEEIKCAREILKSLELRKFGVTFVSCPTCGRTAINLIELAEKVEKYCHTIDKDIKIAVMGCAVNGPGEAREADIGIAGGDGQGLIFKKGEILRKVAEEDLLAELISEINKL